MTIEPSLFRVYLPKLPTPRYPMLQGKPFTRPRGGPAAIRSAPSSTATPKIAPTPTVRLIASATKKLTTAGGRPNPARAAIAA